MENEDGSTQDDQQSAEAQVEQKAESEEVVTPTASLKFVGGKLHQLCTVDKDGASRPEWRPVPEEV